MPAPYTSIVHFSPNLLAQLVRTVALSVIITPAFAVETVEDDTTNTANTQLATEKTLQSVIATGENGANTATMPTLPSTASDTTTMPVFYPATITDTPTTSTPKTYQYQPKPNQPLDAQFSKADLPTMPKMAMPVVDNFDKPVASLSHKTPIIGYDKKLEQGISQQIAQDNTSFNQSQAQLKQEVQQELKQDSLAQNNVAQNSNSRSINGIQVKGKQAEMPEDAITPVNDKATNISQQVGNLNTKEAINPNDYLPDYKAKEATATQSAKTQTPVANKPVNAVKNLYNKVFNRGNASLPKAKVTIVNTDDKLQPAMNIKSALQNVTVESIEDFPATLPRLRQIAREASEAVGYYDTSLSFTQLAPDHIQVTVKQVGDPVKVTARFVDVRGEGGKGDNALPVYEAIQKDIPPKVGDVFNHGVYKQSKATIENVAKNNGFFDGQWLNSSADVILPDNTAEVDLIYDTKSRYHFDDVKFYTIDKKGQLSDDPNKLPVKPKLLKQLMTYQKGDPYFQPYVTQFSNNLLATRYFNGVDIDVVQPTAEEKTNGKLGFDNSQPDSGADDDSTDNVTDSLIKSANTQPTNTQNPNDFAPVKLDADTKARAEAIKQKALRLLDAPENVQLAVDDRRGKGPLAKVADAISKVAKKLDRPDDTPLLMANASQTDKVQKITGDEVKLNKQVPTYVVLNATKPREAQVGIGYETSVGVRAVAKLNDNLINRDGLQAGVNMAVSKVNQKIDFTASRPYTHPLNDTLNATLGYQHDKVDTLNSDLSTSTIHAGISRNIKRESGWNEIYSVRYRYDTLDNQVTSVADRLLLPPPFNNYDSSFTQKALLFGYALNRTVADNTLNPTRGYSQRYSLELGSKNLLTDTDMAILRAGVTGMYSFGEDRKHQVVGGLDLGYIYSKGFYNVPYKLRFFAGGDQSIRGFNTDTQGPTSNGFLVGGNTLAIGTAEYNYEFKPGFRGAIFTDVGNAYDMGNGYKNSTKVGVGGGIRWASPVGMVRVDVAAGVSESHIPVKLYLFIGTPL